jgi:hypothetical protein
VDNESPPQHLHFAHADGCLLSKQALVDISTITMPNKAFALVDDLWFSFVLSHYFGYPIYKLQATACTKIEGADDPKVAMHLNPTVLDARIQLYSYFMTLGWPRFPPALPPNTPIFSIRDDKASPWNSPFVGYNIPSTLTIADMKVLKGILFSCLSPSRFSIQDFTMKLALRGLQFPLHSCHSGYDGAKRYIFSVSPFSFLLFPFRFSL